MESKLVALRAGKWYSRKKPLNFRWAISWAAASWPILWKYGSESAFHPTFSRPRVLLYIRLISSATNWCWHLLWICCLPFAPVRPVQIRQDRQERFLSVWHEFLLFLWFFEQNEYWRLCERATTFRSCSSTRLIFPSRLKIKWLLFFCTFLRLNEQAHREIHFDYLCR